MNSMFLGPRPVPQHFSYQSVHSLFNFKCLSSNQAPVLYVQSNFMLISTCYLYNSVTFTFSFKIPTKMRRTSVPIKISHILIDFHKFSIYRTTTFLTHHGTFTVLYISLTYKQQVMTFLILKDSNISD